MAKRQFVTPLRELEQWYRPRHQFDFPIWETKDEIRLPHVVGYPRMFVDGSVWRLGQNGATAAELLPGYYVESVITVIAEDTITEAVGVLEDRATITVGTTAVTADQFQGGYLQVKDHTGKGYNFPIVGNTEGGGTAGDTITVYLGIELPVALDTTTDVQIVSSPYRNLRLGSASEGTNNGAQPRGIPATNVAASEYFWYQEKGPGIGFANAAIAVADLPWALIAHADGKLIPNTAALFARPVATLLDPNVVADEEAIYVMMDF